MPDPLDFRGIEHYVNPDGTAWITTYGNSPRRIKVQVTRNFGDGRVVVIADYDKYGAYGPMDHVNRTRLSKTR